MVPVPGAVPVCVTTRALLLRIRSPLTLSIFCQSLRVFCKPDRWVPNFELLPVWLFYEKKIRENTTTTLPGKLTTLPRNRWKTKKAGCAVVRSWERVIKVVYKSMKGPMTLIHDD